MGSLKAGGVVRHRSVFTSAGADRFVTGRGRSGLAVADVFDEQRDLFGFTLMDEVA